MAEEYDFEKLAREIVISRLKSMDTAAEAAAEIAKKIIVTAVQSTKVRQDPRVTVTAVCRGIAGGILLIEKDLPEASVTVLKEMGSIAHEVHLDPGDLMTWSMEGFAKVALLAGGDVRLNVQESIERNFMGAGTVFGQICDKAIKSSPGP